MPLEDLRGFASHASVCVRANAIEAIIARHIDDETLAFVLEFVNSTENKQAFMGTVSLAQVAVGALLDSENPLAHSTARALIEAWPKAQKDDLDWFLRNR